MSKNTGTSELINYFDLGVNGDVGISGNLTLDTIVNAVIDTDKFLVSDNGIIKYRTGAELLSDIGSINGTGTTNYLPKFTGASTIGNSIVQDAGIRVEIAGDIRLTPSSAVNIQAYTGSVYTNLFYNAASHNWQTSGGETKMFLNSNDNLLIGTTSDNGARLQVSGNATFSSSVTTATFLRASSGAQSNPTGGASVAIDYQSTADLQGRIRSRDWDGAAWKNLTLEANNIILSPSGNVGIGTSTPDSGKLTILGTNYVVANSGKALGGLDLLTTSNPGSGGYGAAISFAANGTGRAAIAAVQGTSDNDNQGLAFFTHGSTGSSDSVEAMRINSLGNLLVGTTSDNGARLQVSGGYITQSGGGVDTYLGYDSTGSLIGTTTNHYFRFITNNTERLRITSGGNVGIGTASPELYYSGADNLVVSQASGEGGISIVTASNTTGALYFADGTSGSEQYRGGIAYLHSSDTLALVSGGSTRVNITSSGNLLVGGTSDNGARLQVSGVSASSALSLRNTTGGTLADFIITENSGLIVNSYEGASARSIDFRLANTSALLISSTGAATFSGNVTLTTSAQTILSLSSTDTSGRTWTFNTAGTTWYGSGAGSLVLRNNGVDALVFNASSAATFTFDNNSNGIVYSRNVSGTIYELGSVKNSGSDILYQGTGNVFINADSNSDSTAADRNVIFGNRGVEYMRITSSGLVGIANTSPSYIFDVIARASGEGGVRFWNNRANTGTIDSIALNLHVSNSVGQTGGKIVVAENTTDSWPTNMQFWVNGASSSYSPTQAMTITSGGNVLIGTTTDAGYKLDVNGNAYANTLTLGHVGLNVSNYNFYSQTISGAMGILGHNLRASASVANQVNVVNSGWYSSMIKMYYSEGITFHTSLTSYSAGDVYPMAATERMRITSGGNIDMGTQTANAGERLRVVGIVSGSAQYGIFTELNSTLYNGFVARFFNTATSSVVGSITQGVSATSFNTSSDYRLKENVKPVEGALSKLEKLKPRTFNFISEPEKEVMGFLAHEVQEVMPQAVHGQKDEVEINQVEVSPAELDEEGNVITEAVIEEKEVPVYQGIDHSKLVPLLVAAIQEQQEQIKSLKTEIDLLKNKQ